MSKLSSPSAWTSPYAPVEEGGATLPELVRAAARRDPDRPALIDGTSGITVTYAGLAARVDQVASGLAAHGFGPGDVLALCAANRPEWAGVALAAMAAGGAATGVAGDRHGGRARATAARRRRVRARDRARADRSGARRRGRGGRPPRGGDRRGRGRDRAGGAASPRAADARATPASAVALLPFSSGTTGLPKPVMLTHANLVTATRQVGLALRLSPHDALLAAAPFSHVTGFSVVLASGLAAGATVVTLARFTPAGFADALERHRVTVLIGAPPMMAVLEGHPALEGRDLSALRVIASGGAPLGAAQQRRVAARFPHAAVGQGYGLTETTAGATLPDGVAGAVPGSVGQVAPNTELAIVDVATGAALGPGEPGEIRVRGPQVMAGYRDRPDATAAVIDPDGWLRTGDLGVVDPDGNVFVVDRLKELIKVDALQVAPAELEALLLEHPDVADAAVVPRPDERHGEVPVAVVVAARELDDAALLAWVADRVAPHKRLRAVRRVEAIPRTPGGKILRRALR